MNRADLSQNLGVRFDFPLQSIRVQKENRCICSQGQKASKAEIRTNKSVPSGLLPADNSGHLGGMFVPSQLSQRTGPCCSASHHIRRGGREGACELKHVWKCFDTFIIY